MTVLTVDAERARVDHVIEEDWLLRRTRDTNERRRRLERRTRERAHVGHHLRGLRDAQELFEGGHGGREPFGRPAVADHADEKLIGQRVHQPAVGEIGGLRREAPGGWTIAASAGAMARRALPIVERFAELAIALGRRGAHGTWCDDEDDDGGRRRECDEAAEDE